VRDAVPPLFWNWRRRRPVPYHLAPKATLRAQVLWRRIQRRCGYSSAAYFFAGILLAAAAAFSWFWRSHRASCAFTDRRAWCDDMLPATNLLPFICGYYTYRSCSYR